ncbi:MAG: nitrate reductase cytochrome c-type subunit [Candidatus Competibacteraceae bacterium]|nr:nitrate reductase cytochrome c-type subunit [Candidatus Competibacteraceae bacterium]
MNHKTLVLLAAILLPLGVLQAQQGNIDSMRGDVPLLEEPPAPRMADVENEDLRRVRSYPMQPPTIPHKIDGYQVDLRHNRCLSCHSRHRVEQSQAPMISVTHYMDRDGNFLASVSPRRYFCNQCHVIQTEARPLVENTYQDVDTIIQRLRAADPQ